MKFNGVHNQCRNVIECTNLHQNKFFLILKIRKLKENLKFSFFFLTNAYFTRTKENFFENKKKGIFYRGVVMEITRKGNYGYFSLESDCIILSTNWRFWKAHSGSQTLKAWSFTNTALTLFINNKITYSIQSLLWRDFNVFLFV